MAQNESATATVDFITGGSVIEENTLLLDPATREDSGGMTLTTKKGDRVRQRLAVCLFLHIVGVAIVTQVYPRVSLCETDPSRCRRGRPQLPSMYK